MIWLQLSKWTAPRGHNFHLNQNLLWTQKENRSILRNMNNQWALSYPSLFSYFPVLANHSCWKWVHRRKEKDRANHSFFFFQSFLSVLSFSPSLRKRVLIECLHCKKWNNNSGFSSVKHFHYSDKNIYVQAMKNKLSNFGDLHTS